jgi:hypothetical protein
MSETLSVPQTAPQGLAPLAVDENGFRFLIGDPSISSVTIWRLEKRGLLKRVPGIRRKLFTVDSVRAFIAGRTVAA